MRQESSTGQDQLTPDSDRRFLEQLCDRFEDAWKAGQRPSIEAYWADIPEAARHTALQELLLVELAYRIQAGEKPTLKEYQSRFPSHAEIIRAVLQEEMDVIDLDSANAETSGLTEASGRDNSPAAKPEQPHDLGRYQITTKLGMGGFGTVYKAFDPELHREVAVKVPHRHRWETPGYAETFLREARILASLDHPGIVPVFDVDKTKDGLPFVVSKFIEGMDLRARIKQTRPSWPISVEIVARVAEALHYAHQRGLVHRDIKPGNILLDTHGNPVVADFGLALREEDFGTGPLFAGTTAYMSPEQARGEGHLVDARTDIYSLGVVFYELLTGRRPFRGQSREELLELIATRELRPPRQLDDTIPKELDRICLKALGKRASDRYSTAIDLAEELRHWQGISTEKPIANVQAPTHPVIDSPPSGSGTTLTADNRSDGSSVQVVPKGLRSFEAEDADFFLDLLPGPSGRDGLPESIQFWKKRLEETDPDKTFRVGLIYGPSGCGKSSLVKAGLLPRLAEWVTTVYVEAVPSESESRLLTSLRKRCPAMPGDLSLGDSLTWLRRGHDQPAGRKVLIVLDQFEQWLHARREEQNLELVRALRQCDGQHLQCILLVRDDFWMAITRFMRELEIPLVENRNSMAVDLFNPRHARKVLVAFGRAFGAIPKSAPGAVSNEEDDAERFVDQAVDGLAQDGKIIPVRLALFAEMVKGKRWTPSTLREVGGTQGIGVRFLEETFNASTAPPQHRLHQKAARAVLQALLPEPGATLKGQRKSYHELLEASGYARQPREFEELLRILDTELRLVTPTEGDAEAAVSAEPAPPRYYQLTHDYLVPALQQWLVRKQQETLRGRAQLRLAERTAFWSARPKYRHLPGWWEWADILLLTRRKLWVPAERKMMRSATVYHSIRSSILIVVILALGLLAWQIQKASHAHSLVSRLLDADINKVPEIIDELESYRPRVDAELTRTLNNPDTSPKERLRASLALLPVDQSQIDYLYRRSLQAKPDDLLIIRKQLKPFCLQIEESMWSRLKDPDATRNEQLRLACMLADCDENNPSWPKVAKPIVHQLVRENLLLVKPWMDGLRPIRKYLLSDLAEVFRDRHPDFKERYVATSILTDYAANNPHLLAELIKDADFQQYPELFATIQSHRGQVLEDMKKELSAPADGTEENRDRRAKRQANAAVTLFRLGELEPVWPMFRQTPDPSARSYLIHYLSPLGADIEPLLRRWLENQEPDVPAQRALMLSLGEFDSDRLSLPMREQVLAKLLNVYRNHPDSGVHAAAEWLLRQWGGSKTVLQINSELRGKPEETGRSWSINREGHTMVRLDPRNQSKDLSRGKEIQQPFAIADKEVTVEQFLRFRRNHAEIHPRLIALSPEADCPVNYVTWFDAAHYCNWLSEREGIHPDDWCYQPNEKGEYAEGMKAKPNYLQLKGYRLPNEAEWEFACRAGTTSKRYFGTCDELVPKYCWFEQNSNELHHPGGMLKPNDFGLFDMLGNVFEWCQEKKDDNAPSSIDRGDSDPVRNNDSRVVRGGAIRYPLRDLQSGLQRWEPPTVDWDNMGFRVAITVTPQK